MRAQYLILVPVLPLVGAVFNMAVGHALQRRYGRLPVHLVAVGLPFLSFAISLVALIELCGLKSEDRFLYAHIYNWIVSGSLWVKMALKADPLGVVMMLVVSGVGSIIHLYSIGYMAHDRAYWRYFCYLNLFMFSMLMLVMAENLLLMFIGWEGVGLCSYLLIGFWYSDIQKAKAGMKAFVVNRVGDLGFLCGILLLFWCLSTISPGKPISLSFDELKHHSDTLAGMELFGVGVVTLSCIFLFIGATGKSAQLPLYVWLPDAMAGPTPVSALIHAATMVTAGVYMVARMNFLFCHSALAMTIVSLIGALTALYAATIGFFQFDIKKVLAYSTISQLGYMFLGVGVGAYHSGIFHLFTHAFFKACLFLCAGSVIHSLSDEMDIRRMGGLKGKLPHTYKTFLIATLAIAGIPPLSGFFSKDEILWSAFNSESLLIPGWILWILGVFAAACTAFYMFRLLYMTFTGPLRVEEKIRHHIHESPPVMTLPLWILAAGSITAGFLGIPKLNHFEHFLHPVFEDSYRILSTDVHHSMGVELLLMAISVAAALSGIAVARVLYKDMKSRLPERLSEKFKRTYRLIHNKYYVDEIYGASFVKGTIELSRFSGRFDLAVIDGGVNFTGLATRVTSTINGAIDKYFVDGAVNLIAWLIVFFGRRVRKIQTGDIHTYLYGVVVGALLVLIIGYVFFM